MNGRRTFAALVKIAGVFTALATGLAAQNMTDPTLRPPDVAPAPAPVSLSPVILAENPDVVQRFAVEDAAVRIMVNSALIKLTSAPNIATAWTRLGITPQDVVGIKITTVGGPLLSTHRPIVEAICNGLEAAGVTPSNIIVWDKNAADMRGAGYTPAAFNDAQVGIASIFPGTGYDPSVIYKNEIIGTLIWGDSEFVRRDDDLLTTAHDAVKNKPFGDDNTIPGLNASDDSLTGSGSIPQNSSKSYYARLVTNICTKIINVPVLCDNSYVGIDGCLASLALGSVDNNRRFQGEPTYGDPAICEILDQPVLRRKVVVHILDALVAQYAGGPRFDPQFTKSIGAIYVSRDPVAIDSLALKRMEEWRATDKTGRIDLIGKTASHVQSAASYHLGTDDPHRIQLVRLP